jgi:hypothetical protein
VNGERRTPTALGWTCPWSGDENDTIPASYRWWFRLYKRSRIIRHLLGLHDWQYPPIYNGGRYCTWCGKR